jgi:hypothetical protein
MVARDRKMSKTKSTCALPGPPQDAGTGSCTIRKNLSGMGGLLGAKGSATAANTRYGRRQARATIGWRQITFDSGGISIKPSANMAEMKMDMSGAAAVLGTMQAAAQLRLPLHLVALVPAAENLPSGSALKPGDILRHYNGKTSEVDNTDAEGRLILADALAYASKYKPDPRGPATLTGPWWWRSTCRHRRWYIWCPCNNCARPASERTNASGNSRSTRNTKS